MQLESALKAAMGDVWHDATSKRRRNWKHFLQRHPQSTKMKFGTMFIGLSLTLTCTELDFIAMRDQLDIRLPSGLDLTHAKIVLRIAAALGEGAVPFTGLKSAALIGLEIVEAVDMAMDNKEQCFVLAEQVFRILESIRIDETDRDDPTFIAQVEALTRDLRQIHTLMTAISIRKKPNKMLHAQADRDKITQCEKLLDHSRSLFMVQLQLENRKNVRTLGSKVDQILLRLGEGRDGALPGTEPRTPGTPGTPSRSQMTSPVSASSPLAASLSINSTEEENRASDTSFDLPQTPIKPRRVNNRSITAPPTRISLEGNGQLMASRRRAGTGMVASHPIPLAAPPFPKKKSKLVVEDPTDFGDASSDSSGSNEVLTSVEGNLMNGSHVMHSHVEEDSILEVPRLVSATTA